MATQKKFIDYIESLVTVALQSVYGSDIRFVVKLDDAMNCSLLIQEGESEELYSPKDEEGGGVLDICSLALRVVMWSIQKPATRNFMFLDEPMKAIGKGLLLENAMAMIRNINKKLGIQFLINTHVPEIAGLADKTFNIEKKNGVSKVFVDEYKEDIEHKKLNRVKR